jgi:hypothetical protein
LLPTYLKTNFFAQELLGAADKYEMEELKEYCVEVMDE